MRHRLLRLQALTEARRVIAYRAALALDEAAHHADPAHRAHAGRTAALLTPVVKACLTDQGFQAASSALQVFGGYGYVAEYGIEQTLRDARIAMVYEGTNEIQAIDLLQRKVLAEGGAALRGLLAEFEVEALRCDAEPALAAFACALREQVEHAATVTAALLEGAAADAECALRAADDYLFGVAHTLLAWAFAVSARAALGEPDAAWAAAKTERMRDGVQWLLPQAAMHWQRACDPTRVLPALI